MKHFPLDALGPAFLIAAILFGGASSAGFYANALLQIAGASLIALYLLSHMRAPSGHERRVLIILLAALGLAIIQLVPLPPLIWTNLPGRQIVADTYRLAGIAPPWRPLSLTPGATLGAGLAMLPVIAGALIAIYATRRGLIVLFAVTISMMGIAVVLGLTQRATGLDSPFYLYAITNRGYAVGLFANSNHLAALCALSIPMAAALVTEAHRAQPRVRWLIFVAVVPFALLGIAFSASLAGMGLAVIALLASYWIVRSRGANTKLLVAATAAIVLALTLTVIFIAWRSPGMGVVTAGDELGRPALWQRTAAMIGATTPFGTGLGSFSAIYPQAENAMTVTNVFANHAHNDYLETALTGGVPGILLMLWFAAWWARRAIGIWRGGARDAVARAATVVSMLILLHEIVDYPLRTAAIGVIFGLCCGAMARPTRTEAMAAVSWRPARHLSV